MPNFLSRMYANPLDRPVKMDEGRHGVGRDSDAIGGYRGVGWYEHFRDRLTGKIYQVYCSDGVNGGRQSFREEDENWVSQCYDQICERTKAEARAGAKVIKLSANEWTIMLHRTHVGWLDLKPGQKYADGDRSLSAGEIGHIMNVPVVVYPGLEDKLPQKPPSP